MGTLQDKSEEFMNKAKETVDQIGKKAGGQAGNSPNLDGKEELDEYGLSPKPGSGVSNDSEGSRGPGMEQGESELSEYGLSPTETRGNVPSDHETVTPQEVPPPAETQGRRDIPAEKKPADVQGIRRDDVEQAGGSTTS